MTTYNRSNSNWRVPSIEALERNFHESSRFYGGKEDRHQGLKRVPGPSPHGTVLELQEENKYAS